MFIRAKRLKNFFLSGKRGAVMDVIQKYKNNSLIIWPLASTLWTPNFEPYYKNKNENYKKI